MSAAASQRRSPGGAGGQALPTLRAEKALRPPASSVAVELFVKLTYIGVGMTIDANGKQYRRVMPALVAGVHVLKAEAHQDVDGRNKSGHDAVGELRTLTVGNQARCIP